MNFEFKCKVLDEDEKKGDCNDLIVTYLTKFFAEFVGTFLLVFFGCACVLVSAGDNAMCFSFVVGTIVQIFGVLTLANINPAVSLSFYIFGLISLPMLFLYIIAQCLGAIAAAGILEEMVQSHTIVTCFCCTVPLRHYPVEKVFFWEFGSTCFLILLVCSIVHPSNINRLDTIPLKFGALIAALIFSESYYSGTSINPARSFGPAVVYNVWTDHWIYWLAPLLASAVTSVLYHIFILPKNGQDPLIKAMSKDNK